jgi:hypothetical protein
LWPIKILEVFGFSCLLNYVFQKLSKTRELTTFEKQELTLVFGEYFNVNAIRINENSAWLKLTRQNNMGFVLFNTINFSRKIDTQHRLGDMAWLVHEVVHVAQYSSLGMQYIFEALIAQHIGGYKYGEVSSLKNNDLSHYSLEQQGDIIRDYYVGLKSKKPINDFDNCLECLHLKRF